MGSHTALEPLPIRPGAPGQDVPSIQARTKPLTRKQRLFVNYYLRFGNAAKAARMAGFADSVANNATVELLRHPLVAQEINRRSSKIFQQMELTTDKVIEETAKMCISNLADYTEVSEDGKHINVNLAGLDREQWSCVQELAYDQNGKLKIKLYDKRAALELYGRFKKIGFEDNQNNNSQNGKPATIQNLDDIVRKTITFNQTINQYNIQNPNLNLNTSAGEKLIEGSQSTNSE